MTPSCVEHMASATIRLFLPRGDAKSLRTAEISNLTVAQAFGLWSRVLTQPASLRFVIQWWGWTPTTDHFVS